MAVKHRDALVDAAIDKLPPWLRPRRSRSRVNRATTPARIQLRPVASASGGGDGGGLLAKLSSVRPSARSSTSYSRTQSDDAEAASASRRMAQLARLRALASEEEEAAAAHEHQSKEEAGGVADGVESVREWAERQQMDLD